MNLYVLMYDDCALFEGILSCYFLKNKYNIVMVGIDKTEVKVFEGMKIKCDKLIEEILIEEDDVVVIPGGNIEPLKNLKSLRNFLNTCYSKKCILGAICAGVDLLIEHNIINREDIKKYSINNVEIGDKFVFAKPNEYVDFALSLGTICDIYKDKNDFQETIRFFKEFKEC